MVVTAAIFAKLSDVFVTQALRSYLAAAGGLAPPAVADPGIARIVTMLRSRPEARWSVDAGLRLRRAAGYLSATTKSVREIAHLTGYGSEASFSKALRRSPGTRSATRTPPGGPWSAPWTWPSPAAGCCLSCCIPRNACWNARPGTAPRMPP
jgi:hypothetical protein